MRIRGRLTYYDVYFKADVASKYEVMSPVVKFHKIVSIFGLFTIRTSGEIHMRECWTWPNSPDYSVRRAAQLAVSLYERSATPWQKCSHLPKNECLAPCCIAQWESFAAGNCS